MPADEAIHRADEDGSRARADGDESRARAGARHAAPRKPLITRFHIPAGKAIAIAAMPTAVLMGLGFTPTLATAQADDTPSKSLTADEYQNCVEVLDKAKTDSGDSTTDGKDTKQDGSGSTGTSGSDGSDGSGSGSSGSGGSSGSDSSGSGSTGTSGSSGSGSTGTSGSGTSGSGDSGATQEPSPSSSPSASSSGSGSLLGTVTDTLGNLLGTNSTKSSASPSPSASATSGSDTASADATPSGSSDTAGTLKDTVDKVTGTVDDTTKKVAGDVDKTVEDTTKSVTKAAESATSGTSGASATDPGDCPVATDAEGGLEDIVALPDDPWYLDASSLTLKGADYKGVVEVKTASGKVKKVLKYVVSDGTDIGDLHQTVNDAASGKTYHVQAAKGSTSTIRGGDTVMYTESISGKLFGLVPITFSPDFPPPLNLPLIYFTDVKVTQAGQFGGTLSVPGLHQYTTDYSTAAPSAAGGR